MHALAHNKAQENSHGGQDAGLSVDIASHFFRIEAQDANGGNFPAPLFDIDVRQCGDDHHRQGGGGGQNNEDDEVNVAGDFIHHVAHVADAGKGHHGIEVFVVGYVGSSGFDEVGIGLVVFVKDFFVARLVHIHGVAGVGFGDGGHGHIVCLVVTIFDPNTVSRLHLFNDGEFFRNHRAF